MPYALLMDTEPQQQQTVEAANDPAVLGESAGHWAAESLKNDGGAVLEIKPENWEHAKATLVERRHDVKRLQSEGRLVVLDAHKVLAEVTADGSTRPAFFHGIVEEAVGRARCAIGSGPIHVWTETVSLLGEHHGPWMARFARSLWTQAAKDHGLSLLGIEPARDDLDPDALETDSVEGLTEYVHGPPSSKGPIDP